MDIKYIIIGFILIFVSILLTKMKDNDIILACKY